MTRLYFTEKYNLTIQDAFWENISEIHALHLSSRIDVLKHFWQVVFEYTLYYLDGGRYEVKLVNYMNVCPKENNAVHQCLELGGIYINLLLIDKRKAFPWLWCMSKNWHTFRTN